MPHYDLDLFVIGARFGGRARLSAGGRSGREGGRGRGTFTSAALASTPVAFPHTLSGREEKTLMKLQKHVTLYGYYGHAFGQGVVKRAFAGAGADYGYLELAYPVPTWTRQRASSI